MLNAIKLEEFGNIKDYLNILKEKSFIDIKTYNYYIYLLSFLSSGITVNESLKEEDILVDNDTIDSDVKNTIRREAYLKHFKVANKLADDYFNKKNSLNMLLEKRLLESVNEKKFDKRKFMRDNAIIKRYDVIVEEITKLEEANKANNDDKILKKLATIYLNIKNGKVYRKKYSKKQDLDFHDAIELNDFRKALEFNYYFNEKRNIDRDDNPITIVLKDICTLQKRMYHEQITNRRLFSKRIYNDAIGKAHHEMISTGGAVIVDVENNPSTLKVLDEYQDTKALTIEDENGNQKVVITYDGYRIDSNMELADKLYENGNYALAVREYIKVINNSDEYPSYIYYRLGMSYLNLGAKEEAVNYFKIANYYFSNDKEISDMIEELSDGDEKSQGGVKV